MLLLIEGAGRRLLPAAVCVLSFTAGCASLSGESGTGQSTPSAGPEHVGSTSLAGGAPWGQSVLEQHLVAGGCVVGEPCVQACDEPGFPYYCGYACADSPERCESKHAAVLPVVHSFEAGTGQLRSGTRWTRDLTAGQRYVSFQDMHAHPVPMTRDGSYDVDALPSVSVGHEVFFRLGVRLPANGPKRVYADLGIVAPAYLHGRALESRGPDDGCLVTTLTFERSGAEAEGDPRVLEAHALIPAACARLAERDSPLNFAVNLRVPGYTKIEGQTVTFPHRGRRGDNFRAQFRQHSVLRKTVFGEGNPCADNACPAFVLLPGTVGPSEEAYGPGDFPGGSTAANYVSLFLDPDPLTNPSGVVAIRTANDGHDYCKDAEDGNQAPLFTVTGNLIPLGYGRRGDSADGAEREISFGADPVELRYDLCDEHGADCVALPFKGVPRNDDGMVCVTEDGVPTRVREPDECLRRAGHVWRAKDPAARTVATLEKASVGEDARFRHQVFLGGEERGACGELRERGWVDGPGLQLRLCATRPGLGFFNDQSLEYQRDVCASTPVSLVSDDAAKHALLHTTGTIDGAVDESKLSGKLGTLFITTASVGARQVQSSTRVANWFEPANKGIGKMAALFFKFNRSTQNREAAVGAPAPMPAGAGVVAGMDAADAYASLSSEPVAPLLDISTEVYTGTKRLAETPGYPGLKETNGEKQQSLRFYYGALGYLNTVMDWQGDLNESQAVQKDFEVDLVSMLAAMDTQGLKKRCLTWYLWTVGFPGSVSVCPWVKVGAYVDMSLGGPSGEPGGNAVFPEASHSGQYRFDYGATLGSGVTLKLNVLDIVALKAGVAGDLTALKVKWAERTGVDWGIWDGSMHARPVKSRAGGAGAVRFFDGKAYVYVSASRLTLWQKDLWTFQGFGHEWENLRLDYPETVIQ